MVCTKESVASSGLNIWSGEAAAGSTPVVDIIAVQGLGAHPYFTWVKKVPPSEADKPKRFRDKTRFWKSKKEQSKGGEDRPTEVMWLRDLLVPLFQNARIASYSYESDWRDRQVQTSLRECADQFLNVLYQQRRQANECKRPLVLIGHSLGCLVIQQALVNAVHRQEFTDLRLSVAGMIFLGAPFQGSDAAIFGEWLARLWRLDSTLLERLRKGNPDLFALSTDFCGSYIDRDVVCFYEKRETEYLRSLKTKVVNSQSASLLGRRSIFLNTDHSGLNKFSIDDDPNFALVLPEIQRMVVNSHSAVAERHKAKGGITIDRGNKHWMVPRPVNGLFTGRVKLLLRIQEALRNNHTSPSDEQKRFVITGLGGQGKSEICLKVASLMREEFWGIFWVDVGKTSIAESNFIAIAKMIGRAAEDVSEALQVLAATKQSWLLILDNADDPNFDYQLYLPSGTHGAVIMTSRIPECRKYGTVGAEALEGLDEEQSQELLLRAAELPRESWPSHSSHANEVVSLLGSHMLALIQAGAYISNGHCQLHEYPEVYCRQRKRLLAFRPKQAQSRYCDVYATFEAPAAVLEQSESETARDALQLLAILSMLDSSFLPLQIFKDAWHAGRDLRTEPSDPSTIYDLSLDHLKQLPCFMLEDGNIWDTYRLIEASSLLASHSLVIRHDSNISPGLSMHVLIHAWAKERLGSEQQSVAWIAAGCVLALSRDNPEVGHIQGWRLLPHVQSYLDIRVSKALSFGLEVIVVPILLACGWLLDDMRQHSRLSYLLEDMFLELGENPDEVSQESLPLYILQVRNLSRLSKSKKAVHLAQQVDKINEDILAADDRDRLSSQHELAVAYQENGQTKEAIDLLEQVVKIKETVLAIDDPDRLASQHALAVAYQENRQTKEAIDLLEQVVKIEETVLAVDNRDRHTSQHALAIVYRKNGQIKEAIELLEQVIKIEGTVLADDDPDRLASQHELAVAYRKNRQTKEAIDLLEQVVKIEGTVLAVDNPDRLASQHALAISYQENGQTKEAIELLEQVVKIKGTALAVDNPDRLKSQQELSVTDRENGQVEEAIDVE